MRTRASTHVTGINESSPLVRTIQKVVEEVEDVRGLWRKTTLQVVILDDVLFSKALRAKAEKELTPQAIASESARWTAFGLAPAEANPRNILLGVLDEQVAGFYDPTTKALTVREKPPASAGGMDSFEMVLAHEVEHALQDQHFGFPDMEKLPDDDVRLARMALYEGDAMATMIAVAARRAGRPVKLSISAAASALRGMSAAQLAQSAGYSPELAQAPAVVREELAFPYVSGLGLVAEVYRRGGFALVDKIFEHAPETTHQVLHPEAYLAGELPARVPYPAPPPGTQTVATGRMGELGTRLALQVCVDEQVARDFAQHWAGDAYTIVRGPQQSLALVWGTNWSADGARQFANLLGMQSPCWDEAARSHPEGYPFISAAAQVRVDAPRVALARGLPVSALGGAAASASRFDVRKPAPVAPLGQVREDEGGARASVADGRFVSPRLRIEADVPPGFDADVEQPSAEIVVRKSRPQANASLLFVPEPPRWTIISPGRRRTRGVLPERRNDFRERAGRLVSQAARRPAHHAARQSRAGARLGRAGHARGAARDARRCVRRKGLLRRAALRDGRFFRIRSGEVRRLAARQLAGRVPRLRRAAVTGVQIRAAAR